MLWSRQRFAGYVECDVDEHVLLAADHAASIGLFEQGAGVDVEAGVGQHTNDKELSFYAVTASGLEWEVGWNPVVVDETTWDSTTYQGISTSGHTREGRTIIDKLSQFKTGAASLPRDEDVVPPLAGAGIPDH